MAQKQMAFDLAGAFVQLQDGPSAVTLAGGAEFWSQIEKRVDWQEGRLVAVTQQAADWTSWEMHPAGDEVLYLLSGEMELVLDQAGGKRSVKLRPGMAFIIPRGVWHTATVQGAGELLSITRGAGTQHREL